jgi:hypothetical protein
MAELLLYGRLGFHHIANLNAADHMLFLLALAAVYRLEECRPAIWVITAFTLGHSVTLALAVSGIFSFPSQLIETLIPVTIVATCIENIRGLGPEPSRRGQLLRAGLAGAFGLVHGAGFANYLSAMFANRLAVPLLGFNLGIEAGQVLILAVSIVLFWLADRILNTLPVRPGGFRIRVITTSLVIAVFATQMVIDRAS